MHEEKLSSLLSQPWLARELFSSVRNDTEGLLEAIHRYIKYLQQHNTSMQQVHHQNEPPRTMDDNVSMYTLPASCVSTSDGYKELDDALVSEAG